MGQINLSIPVSGQPNSTEDPKVASDFTIIQNAINGGLDATNISAALAQSAAVNQGAQTVKGAVNIATSQSTSSTTYTTLATPDQVAGIVLPTNGLIAVWYWALWQESVLNAGRAAILLGANQIKLQSPAIGANAFTAARTGGGAVNNSNHNLFSFPGGLASANFAASADVTTGQIVGAHLADTGAGQGTWEVGAALEGFPGSSNATVQGAFGGPCYFFAAAGTYTVSVQFKASSGSVTASNRLLMVQALSFA